MKPPLYLIDSSIYIFRAWFSISEQVVDKQGRPHNAFTGFFNFTTRFLKQVRPSHVVFVFDESLEESFRNEIYPPYKANREPAPEELKRQFVHCRQLIKALGISELASTRYEADDLIGTLAARAHQQAQPVVIVSGDKDLAQLISENDIWWDYARNLRLSAKGICNRFGVYPQQMADWLALTGDAVDNIPGVPGIGPVTAARLITHFGDLKTLLEQTDTVSAIKGLRRANRLGGLIDQYAETIQLSKQLTTICTTASLPENFNTAVAGHDLDAYDLLSTDLGMQSYRRKLFLDCAQALQA